MMRSLSQIDHALSQYKVTLQRQDARHITLLPDRTIFHRIDKNEKDRIKFSSE